MTASVTDVLMGIGSGAFSIKQWSQDLADDLDPDRRPHLLLYEGQRLVNAYVLTERTIAEGKIRLGLSGLAWHLGLDDEGPISEDQEWLAGNNHLSNPSAERDFLDWTRGEESQWAILETPDIPLVAGGSFRTGTKAFIVLDDPSEDDHLISTEARPCRPGETWRLAVHLWRPGMHDAKRGRIRLRSMCTPGPFFAPNVLYDGDLTKRDGWAPLDADALDPIQQSETLAHPDSNGYYVKVGPTTRLQILRNPSFEETPAMTGWVGTGDWYRDNVPTPVDGLYTTSTQGSTDVAKFLRADAGGGVAPVPHERPIGERWLFEAMVRPIGSSLNGEAHISLQLGESIAAFATATTWRKSEVFKAGDSIEGGDWQHLEVEWDVKDKETFAIPHLVVDSHTATDSWWTWDMATLTRTTGNVTRVIASLTPVVGGRNYRLRAMVATSPGLQRGTIKVLLRLTGPDRVDHWLESSAMEPPGPQAIELDLLTGDPLPADPAPSFRELILDFTPPSGYDLARPYIEGRDIEGGHFALSDVSIRPTQLNESLMDTVSVVYTAGYTLLEQERPIPEGAENIHFELIAEQGAGGWRAEDCFLGRVVDTPATVDEVVAEIFTDPESRRPIFVPGLVVGSEDIRFDWRTRNLTRRQQLEELCTQGLTDPPREWRINADGTYDVATSEQLYRDRSDVVLVSGMSLELLSRPEVTRSSLHAVTRVKVIGAERAGQAPVSAVAERQAASFDWFGEPVHRTRIIEDSTVETYDYALALAEEELEKANRQVLSVDVSVSDMATFGGDERSGGPPRVGDWVRVYEPEAGLVDEAQPTTVRGQPVFPAKVRIVSAQRRYGPGHRLELRRHDGSIRDLTREVEWEPTTGVDLTVADVRPEFMFHSQGASRWSQFLRYRKSSAPH